AREGEKLVDLVEGPSGAGSDQIARGLDRPTHRAFEGEMLMRTDALRAEFDLEFFECDSPHSAASSSRSRGASGRAMRRSTSASKAGSFPSSASSPIANGGIAMP